jgi:hypothetical protein
MELIENQFFLSRKCQPQRTKKERIREFFRKKSKARED